MFIYRANEKHGSGEKEGSRPVRKENNSPAPVPLAAQVGVANALYDKGHVATGPVIFSPS